MVDGALGHEENEAPRLVKSPWFDHEVPFDLAAANHLDTNGDPPQELTTDTACLLIPAAL